MPDQAVDALRNGLDHGHGPCVRLRWLAVHAQHASGIPGRSVPVRGSGRDQEGATGAVRRRALGVGGLPRATCLVVGAKGALYVAVNRASAGNGAVWRIEPKKNEEGGG